MAEQHLFILWEKARNKEQEILDEIKSQFKILKEYEIQWDENKFLDNMTSFYGFNHSDRYYIQEERGSGKFLVVFVEDENPEYMDVQTTKGFVSVNKMMYESKQNIRKKYFDGKFLIHTTNNIKETKHDICLLLGKSLDDLNKSENWDGGRVFLKQNLPAVDGWKTREQIFYILNETVNYVVIRDCDVAPYLPIRPNTCSYYYDVEILTDDIQSLRYTLQPKTSQNNEFAFGIFLDVDGKEQPFHYKFLGDRYFDINIERKLLESRKLNQNNVYIVGNDELYFYTLFYHSIIHKENYKKYNEIFSKLAKKLKIDYKCDLDCLKQILHDWMKKNNYQYHQTIDMNSRTIMYHNIIDKNLINNEPMALIFQTGVNTVIFTSDLIIKNPVLASEFLKNMNVYFKFHEHIMPPSHKLYPEFKKYIKKNQMGWLFRKRFGRIVKTTACFNKKHSNFEFKRQVLGTPRKIKSKYLTVQIDKKRKYIDGKDFGHFLKNVTDEKLLKIYLEKFFGEVFRKFKIKNSDNLNPLAWDALPYNCILSPENEYKFFDLEYKLNEPLTKSYFVYRAIKHTPSLKANSEKLYNYFCKRLQLESLFHYYSSLDFKISYGLSDDNIPKHASLFVYLAKKFSLFFVSFVPVKKLRKKFREKIKKNFDFWNCKLIGRYFY